MAKIAKFTTPRNGKAVFVNIERICFIEEGKHEDQTSIIFSDDLKLNVAGSCEETYHAMKLAS